MLKTKQSLSLEGTRVRVLYRVSCFGVVAPLCFSFPFPCNSGCLWLGYSTLDVDLLVIWAVGERHRWSFGLSRRAVSVAASKARL